MPTQTRRSLVRADGPLPRSTLARRRDASETARTLRNTDCCAAQRNAEHPCADTSRSMSPTRTRTRRRSKQNKNATQNARRQARICRNNKSIERSRARRKIVLHCCGQLQRSVVFCLFVCFGMTNTENERTTMCKHMAVLLSETLRRTSSYVVARYNSTGDQRKPNDPHTDAHSTSHSARWCRQTNRKKNNNNDYKRPQQHEPCDRRTNKRRRLRATNSARRFCSCARVANCCYCMRRVRCIVWSMTRGTMCSTAGGVSLRFCWPASRCLRSVCAPARRDDDTNDRARTASRFTSARTIARTRHCATTRADERPAANAVTSTD